MISALVYIAFVLSAIFTAVAITRENWPRVLVAFGGMFTGIMMIPVVFQLMVTFHG